MYEIAAIPTTYRGVQFRSRLEAKWASFFDHLGIHWEYEPLDLNGWIPDFAIVLPKNTKQITLIEVKPLEFIAPTQATIDKISRALKIPDYHSDNLGFLLYLAFERYVPVIVGAWPAIYGLHCCWGNPVDETRIGLGWTPAVGGWQVDFDLLSVSPQVIKKAWRKATNRAQWKRPA